jgi:RHS repeat-associated protein
MIKELEYSSFGALINDSDPWFDLTIGFSGGIVDPITKLVRFGFRDYDPETGRWTAKAPILFAGGQMNLYAYVLNNPVNYKDPYGLGPFEYGLNSFIAIPQKSSEQPSVISSEARNLVTPTYLKRSLPSVEMTRWGACISWGSTSLAPEGLLKIARQFIAGFR